MPPRSILAARFWERTVCNTPEHCVAGDQERLAQAGQSITDVAFVERSRIGPVSHFGQPSRPLEYRLAVKKEARNSTGV